jgi:hypothetical protein
MRILLQYFIIFLALISGAQGLQAFSNDTVTINTPINDDIFLAGGSLIVNAPVSSVTAIGSNININAPVAGDVYAVGGDIAINSRIGGKVVLAGGNINLGGNVGTNALLAGGQVNILPDTTVGRDVLIGGGNVNNAGTISGNLTVRAGSFQNHGSARSVDFQRTETNRTRSRAAMAGFNFFGLLVTLGYLTIGLLLLRYLPGIFHLFDDEMKKSPVIRAVIGFVMLIVTFIIVIILLITMIGIPIAVILGLLYIVAIMLAGVFVSYSLGRQIGKAANLKYGDMVLFLIGFVALNVLFLIPFVGGFIKLAAVSLGFGTFLYAILDNWVRLRSQGAAPA